LVELHWGLGTIAGLLSGQHPNEIQRSPLPGCLEPNALKGGDPDTYINSLVERPTSPEICRSLARATLW
jgi:hypothetical protein